MNYINIKLLCIMNIFLKHNLNKHENMYCYFCFSIRCFNIYEYYYTER